MTETLKTAADAVLNRAVTEGPGLPGVVAVARPLAPPKWVGGRPAKAWFQKKSLTIQCIVYTSLMVHVKICICQHCIEMCIICCSKIVF